MLTAVNQWGEKLSSLQTGKEILKKLSNDRKLFCPYCHANLIFHAGSQRIYHFKHHHSECTHETEPETIDHLMGKATIYNWLKGYIVGKYPSAIIETEYRIEETNQIADVYFEPKPNIRFVFEIQCSPMQIEEWKRRRKLYRDAGIIDIWIFGTKNHFRFDKDREQVQYKSLQNEVNRKERHVYYWDAEMAKLYHTGNLITSFEENPYITIDLDETLTFIPTKSSRFRFVIGNQKSKKILEKYFNTRSRIAFEKWEKRKLAIKQRKEEERRLLEEREKEKERIRKVKDSLISYYQFMKEFSFEKVMKKMTTYELLVFKQLIKKYQFTEDNFPAIFCVKLNGGEAIITPPYFWQLLVFDRAITANAHPKNLIFPKFFFKKIIKYLRYHEAYEAAKIIHHYLLLLEQMKFIKKETLTRKYNHPFTIKDKNLPVIEDREINRKVALYYTIEQFYSYKDVYEELSFNDSPNDLIAAIGAYWKNHFNTETYKVATGLLLSNHEEATRKLTNNVRNSTPFSKEEEQSLWNRIYRKAMETNMKLGQTDKSGEVVLEEETVLTEISKRET